MLDPPRQFIAQGDSCESEIQNVQRPALVRFLKSKCEASIREIFEKQLGFS